MERSTNVFKDITDDDCFDTDIKPYLPALLEIIERSKLGYELTDEQENGHCHLTINIPTQKDPLPIYIFTVDEAKMLINSEFYKYHALKNYDGIFSRSQNYIECGIKFENASPILTRNLIRKFTAITLTSPYNKNVKLELSKTSKNLSAIAGVNDQRLTLRISGVPFDDIDPEIVLEKYANSLLFQLDVINERPISLQRRKATPSPLRRAKSRTIKFPEIEIEKGPIALYWHARDAAQLPMFQYLAYYQSVEYFFPRLSRLAAHKKVQALLKDPAFRATSDSDIERVFNTIKLTNTNRLGDEKSQLHAVITECLLSEEIHDFITENEERKSHFTSNKKQIISKHKISLNDSNGIIGTTAARLYDIRCRVVHSKSEDFDNQSEVLLPNSPESDLLMLDIELMKFIAQKVLIHTSNKLH